VGADVASVEAAGMTPTVWFGYVLATGYGLALVIPAVALMRVLWLFVDGWLREAAGNAEQEGVEL
jgi:hypothetical protein